MTTPFQKVIDSCPRCCGTGGFPDPCAFCKQRRSNYYSCFECKNNYDITTNSLFVINTRTYCKNCIHSCRRGIYVPISQTKQCGIHGIKKDDILTNPFKKNVCKTQCCNKCSIPCKTCRYLVWYCSQQCMEKKNCQSCRQPQCKICDCICIRCKRTICPTIQIRNCTKCIRANERICKYCVRNEKEKKGKHSCNNIWSLKDQCARQIVRCYEGKKTTPMLIYIIKKSIKQHKPPSDVYDIIEKWRKQESAYIHGICMMTDIDMKFC